MVYTPHTDDDRRVMLEAIGVGSLAELFTSVPEQHRFPKLDLPEALSEMDVLRELQTLSDLNLNANSVPTFLGAGAYRHWSSQCCRLRDHAGASLPQPIRPIRPR